MTQNPQTTPHIGGTMPQLRQLPPRKSIDAARHESIEHNISKPRRHAERLVDGWSLSRDDGQASEKREAIFDGVEDVPMDKGKRKLDVLPAFGTTGESGDNLRCIGFLDVRMKVKFQVDGQRKFV